MVSREDIDQMERLKNIMEGKKSTPVNHQGRIQEQPVGYQKDPKDDMAEILSRMYGKKSNIQESSHQPISNTQQKLSQDEMVDRMINGHSQSPVMKENISHQKQKIVLEDNFQIVVELYPGSKIRKLYSITNNGNLTEYQNFQMFETAQLIIECYDNKKQIDLYIKKDQEFSNLIKESLFYKSKAEKSKQLNEAEAEKILITKSKDFSNSAQNIQRSMRDLIKLF